jgi:hypothetical protein
MAETGQTFESVTRGHIRSHGCRDLLVYCEAINLGATALELLGCVGAISLWCADML